MPQFSDSTLEQVRSIGIGKIVEPYVELRPKSGGRDLWGLCPFHNEHSPSFKIDEERGFFKCFGCDAKGDGISFIMRHLGLAYPDAILFIAEKFGVNIEYVGEDNKDRKDIIALHEDIQKELRKSFYEDSGKDARNYILNRSFTDEDLNTFGLGFAEGGSALSHLARRYGNDVLTKSGFFKAGRSGQPVSRFFNRLTLPIRNITGSIAAFAGRSLDGGMPKYLNSAESDTFHKRETLFNLDIAKQSMKSRHSCIVVEGYFDVMRLYKIGYHNTVAPMGTALTGAQINVIRRYAEEVTVIFDGDEAGEKAAYRSLANFIEAGVFPKAVFLPEDDDPDTFALRTGREGFDKIYEKRGDLFLTVSERLAKSAGADFNRKLIRFQSVKKMLATVNDPHLRGYYSDAVSDIFKLKRDDVNEDIARSRYKNSVKKTVTRKTNYPCEMDFIACIAALPIDVIDSLVFDITPEMFNDDSIKIIFKKILEFYTTIGDIKDLAHELGEEFIELASREIQGDIYRQAIVNKQKIVQNHLKDRQSKLIDKMKQELAFEQKLLLMKELDELTKALAVKNTHQGD